LLLIRPFLAFSEVPHPVWHCTVFIQVLNGRINNGTLNIAFKEMYSMRAVQLSQFGGPEVLKLIETATPVPGHGQVVVRVRAVGVNLADTLMRADRYAMTPPLPCVLGNEIAGTIESIGAGVEGLKIGSRVAVPLFAAGIFFGGYAETVLVDAGILVPMPDALSFEDATALLVQGLTALHLTLQASPAGKTVLINAAAGGVGSLLVQLAKRAGAKTVIAAASTSSKLDFVRALGADVGVNYTESTWTDDVRAATGGNGPDIIYESVGGDVTRDSLNLLAPLGRMLIYGALNIQSFALGVPELLGLIFKNQSVGGFALVPLLTPENLKAGLGELFALCISGELKVTIGGVHPLAEAGAAHRALESRGTMGKILLTP
jgi:NADPH:quinone reductase